jgi:hypothetical protein
MELLNFIFRLGVLFAIYGFIWVLIELGLALFRSARPKTIIEEYLIKSVKYLFLTDVTFLFCADLENGQISNYNLIMASFVLLTYFIGKFQKEQNRLLFFSNIPGLPRNNLFNPKAESFLIGISVLLFIGFTFYPELAYNPISQWFRSSITDIEETAIIGFIFKVIGFFFLIGMITKMINGVMYILSGRPFIQASRNLYVSNGKKDEGFDDFEEVD